MPGSGESSRSFYARLGADRLAARTTPEWDEKIVAALIEMLPGRGRVLDLGCGYGRIALPLARRGYDVAGLDLSPTLLAAARTAADAEGIAIDWTLGSMTQLPYPGDSFDAVLSLWSAFAELLEADEQIETVREVLRVLRPGGFALVEGPRLRDPPSGARIVHHVVEGIPTAYYAHDVQSLSRICRSAGAGIFRVFEDDWAGRRRLFLRLEKGRSRNPHPPLDARTRSQRDKK